MLGKVAIGTKTTPSKKALFNRFLFNYSCNLLRIIRFFSNGMLRLRYKKEVGARRPIAERFLVCALLILNILNNINEKALPLGEYSAPSVK